MPARRSISGDRVGENMWEMERRRYSVVGAGGGNDRPSVMSASSDTKLRRSRASLASSSQQPQLCSLVAPASEDLHAWSIYRQNLNSDFTDSALGSSEKSPLPYGNFQLRDSTVQSILAHPRYGPKSALGSNMYTYLKFGLPRVLPPNGKLRDGSSGYDSSEDGNIPVHDKRRQQSYHLRTRSDPDFRNTPYYGTSIPPPPATNIRGKSISEANLLSSEAATRHTHLPPKSYRRSVHDLRTMSELGPPLDGASMPYRPHPSSHLDNNRPASVVALTSKASCHSMLDIRSQYNIMDGTLPPSVINAQMSNLEPISPPSFHGPRSGIYSGHYPHLQIRGLSVERRKNEPLLQSLTFEIKAGELLTIMATTETEGTALLDALATGKNARVQHVILNGQNVTLNTLRRRLVYVRQDTVLSPNLNVAQTLTFHSHLRYPPKTSMVKTSVSEQMGIIIEELGLSQVLTTSVSELTISEMQRLKIACYLLSGAEIVLLDKPTMGMDIFDTFFLVEFLRQWANGGPNGVSGKIVILTLQPPTFEIFTMVSRVALISGGLMMFYGKRRDMLPYFTSVDYPCPAYKNPSDYYLDLVTLDELSAEAMLESSQRVEQLAEVFRHRQGPLTDPGPPQSLPGRPRYASCISQIVAIVLRQMVYSQPQSFVSWISHLLIALFMSVLTGVTFWDIPRADPQLILNDRLGFHYAVMHIGVMPLLLIRSLLHTHDKDRLAVESDIKDRLYSRTIYIVVMLLCQLPATLVIWLAYIVPSFAMSSLYQQADDPDAFYIYIGYMLLYMYAMQSFFTLVGYLLPNRYIATSISVFVMLILNITSGFALHLKDLTIHHWLKEWLKVVSPSMWVLAVLLKGEFSTETLSAHSSHLVCRNKQIQHQDIIVQLPCPTPNGTAALKYYGMLPGDLLPHHLKHLDSVWAVLILWAVPTLATILAFTFFGRFLLRKKFKRN